MSADLSNPFGESCCDGGDCRQPHESARPCGCDPGANHLCEWHRAEAEFSQPRLRVFDDQKITRVSGGLETINLLDHGYVKLIESWGSDERIIESARMSTGAGFKGWEKECGCCHGDGVCEYPGGEHGPCSECKGAGKVPGDSKLLKFLWEHEHMTPFEMAGLTLEMQLPLFVARELIRHRSLQVTDDASINEMSARYTELPNLLYIPSTDRLMRSKQSSKNKQGSEFGFSEADAIGIKEQIDYATAGARYMYGLLLEKGVSREVARLVLPVNQYTRWRMSGNLRNWLAMLSLRLPDDVQEETQEYARATAVIVHDLFPRTFSLFAEGKEININTRGNSV